jgi:hypothetical protein
MLFVLNLQNMGPDIDLQAEDNSHVSFNCTSGSTLSVALCR